jgi:hypothetical protein
MSTKNTVSEVQRTIPVGSALAEIGLSDVDEASLQESFKNDLYLHAKLDSEGKLALLPPERAIETRLFRKLGSHRFLHVNVEKNVPEVIRESFFGSPKHFCGRRWALFWCKMGKSPQCYILFAESGVGIEVEQELSVEQLRDWCIPRALNPDITIGKFMKRLKLSLSKVTSSGILPKASVELLSDFGGVGKIQEIDGCGLVSRGGLNFLWKVYSQKSLSDQKMDVVDEECPYTGFQGRLGGFKGAWILDEALGDGIRFQCRTSQYKYRLHQKCLVSTMDSDDSDFYDPEHDIMEVCSWDKKPQAGALNARLIQMLEAGGVPYEHFEKYADAATKRLTELSNDSDALVAHLRERQATLADRQDKDAVETENMDSTLVFDMSVSRVDPSEYVFLKKRTRLVTKEFKQMRKKVNRCMRMRDET